MDIKHEIEVDVPASFIYEKLTNVESLTENLPSNIVMRSEDDQSSFVVGSQWIVRAQRTGRKFSLKTVLMIADKVLSSLEFVHYKHFVHRNI